MILAVDVGLKTPGGNIPTASSTMSHVLREIAGNGCGRGFKAVAPIAVASAFCAASGTAVSGLYPPT